MKIIYKQSAKCRLKELIQNAYDEKGGSFFENMEYITATQKEVDELWGRKWGDTGLSEWFGCILVERECKGYLAVPVNVRVVE
jgi:hypothetical protein